MKSTSLALLLTVCLGALSSFSAQAQEKEQKLSENISIRFPAEFKKQEMGPSTIYNLRLADSTANFVVVVSNMEQAAGLDAATLAAASLEAEFWDQAEQGFLAQMGEGAKLVTKEMKLIGGVDIMELVIDRPGKEGEANNLLTVYIFVQDVYSFNIAYTNRGGKGDEKLKKAYFESLTIK